MGALKGGQKLTNRSSLKVRGVEWELVGRYVLFPGEIPESQRHLWPDVGGGRVDCKIANRRGRGRNVSFMFAGHPLEDQRAR